MSRLSELQAKVGQFTEEERQGLTGKGWDLWDMSRLVSVRRAVRAGFYSDGDGVSDVVIPAAAAAPEPKQLSVQEQAALDAINRSRALCNPPLPPIRPEQVIEIKPLEEDLGFVPEPDLGVWDGMPDTGCDCGCEDNGPEDFA